MAAARRAPRARDPAWSWSTASPRPVGRGAPGRRPGRRPRGRPASTPPATAGPATCEPTSATGRRAARARQPGPGHLRRLLDGGPASCLHLALAHPDVGRAGSCWWAAPPGIDDADERAARRARIDEHGAAGSRSTALDRVPRAVAGPAALRRPDRRAGRPIERPPANTVAGLAVEPPARRHRHPGAAVGPPGRARVPGAGHRRRPTTPSSPRSAERLAAAIGPTATVELVPGRRPRRPPRAARRLPEPSSAPGSAAHDL